MSKDLFDQNGHLTLYAFDMLTEGSLDDLSRLEISEHLDFCDMCVEKYSDYLTDDIIMDTDDLLKPSIIKSVRNKAGRIFFNRFTRVSVAAAVSIAILFTGNFTPSIYSEGRQSNSLYDKLVGVNRIIYEATDSIMSDAAESIYTFKNSFYKRGD